MARGRFDFIKLHLRGPRILDVGNLGDGDDEASIHKKIRESFGDTCDVIGLDSNEKKARELNFPGQVIGKAENMPFKNEFFDCVYMGEIIEHTFEPIKMIKEVNRVLKTGGVLVIDTPNVYALSRILRFFLKKMDSIGDPDHKLFYTPAVLKNMLEKNGFIIEIMSSNLKFGFRSKTFYLPKLKIFKMLGGHLCIKAIKK
ncbi:MAG: methyltransferase domain-containing protein [Patescibacteria group bacterium]|nr:methyltransferase domain-containing protein [Patescibacteria group bacterium]